MLSARTGWPDRRGTIGYAIQEQTPSAPVIGCRGVVPDPGLDTVVPVMGWLSPGSMPVGLLEVGDKMS